MTPEVWAALIGGAAGLATGVVGSLVAPWVNWGVDKRRFQHERRRALIDEWRAGVAATEQEGDWDNLDREPWWQTISPYVSAYRRGPWWRRLRKRIARKPKTPAPMPPSGRTIIVSQTGARIGLAVEIRDVINRKARRWRVE